MSEKHQCCGQVWSDVFRESRNCGNRAKFEVNGKWYCGVHNPNKNADKPRCQAPQTWGKGVCGSIIRNSDPLCSYCMKRRATINGNLEALLTAIAKMDAAGQDTAIARAVAEKRAAGWAIQLPWQEAAE
jgi:hypothetical protein